MPINPTKYIWFNGELVPWEKATVHVMTHALHYGSSVFEGVRCYNTPKGPAVFRLAPHTRSSRVRTIGGRGGRSSLLIARKPGFRPYSLSRWAETLGSTGR